MEQIIDYAVIVGLPVILEEQVQKKLQAGGWSLKGDMLSHYYDGKPSGAYVQNMVRYKRSSICTLSVGNTKEEFLKDLEAKMKDGWVPDPTSKRHGLVDSHVSQFLTKEQKWDDE